MKADSGLLLIEVSEGVSVEDVRAATGCNFEVNNLVHVTHSLVFSKKILSCPSPFRSPVSLVVCPRPV